MPQQSIRFGGCRFGEVYAFYIFLRPDMTNKVDWALKANYLLTYFSRTLCPHMIYQVGWALKANYLLTYFSRTLCPHMI